MIRGKILALIGTRPEAIKMLPVLKDLKQCPEFEIKLGVTGQHRELLEKNLQSFQIPIDWDLGLMRPNQSLSEVSARCLSFLPRILDECSPDLVLVQGDTTTAVMASLSSFFKKIPVAHVEAGLRTGNRYSPFPEEMNRIMLSALAEIHFCPTPRAKNNLLVEGIPESDAFVTGNTSIDALKEEWELNHEFPGLKHLIGSKKMVLVTAHRRENFGSKLEGLFQSLRKIADHNPGFQFIYPVHPNPEVKTLAWDILSEHERIHLIEPVTYSELIYLMRHSCCVLTDSGGIQEEAPTVGVPTLILRENTERPEALETGFAQLVGTDPKRLYDTFMKLKTDGAFERRARWVGGPFGDGKAAPRIVDILRGWWFLRTNAWSHPSAAATQISA
ncbi:UDP-N-acetylglucosamine 2-epimerase (non-hydrolyzing) [bacterium]|nr:UDP-N-acetylglucosamine 2-epimerase (non-hydrolyzing) [bacterium]